MARKSSIAEPLQQEVGRRIQNARRAQGMKQEQLAAALGVSRATMSNIERGTQRLFVDQVYEAAGRLGVLVTALLPPVQEVVSAPAVRTAVDDDRVRALSEARLTQAVTDVLGRAALQSARRGDAGSGARSGGRPPRGPGAGQ